MDTVRGNGVVAAAKKAFEAGEGILRLAPNWVPRSFLQPGLRLKLHPNDYYALGTHRGGIDERWFASTTHADNEGAPDDEGLSYAIDKKKRFTLRDAVPALGADLIGEGIWKKFKRWPVYSKFFDNMGPIPHHLHQKTEQVKALGREGKPEAYYFPPQLNAIGNNFPHTYFGLEPGTRREDVRQCIERWNEGDNGILDYAKAYRLTAGTGWLVGPCILHAPGSLVTYEPQWGSDVFAMYQSIVEGRPTPRELLVKDVPEDKKWDLDYIVDLIDWETNLDTHFRDNHFLEPIPDGNTASEGYVDRWVVYGKIGGKQYFSAKELTVQPGVKMTLKDKGASGVITMQGRGRIGKMPLECPAMIRYGELTEDEVFISAKAANEGVVVENLGKECPLVLLRYFGPEVNPNAPKVGAYKKG
ncbi:MAG: hypothetical protein NTZ09_16120 [Candidatus Hydrogenedentes bacterium]|nr:hypothetical protein [Candidatus Hydrogenedentota bacterium]